MQTLLPSSSKLNRCDLPADALSPNTCIGQAPDSAGETIADPSAKRTRVRTGCWTCRARRKKCDEGRPGCNNCQHTGYNCAGYGERMPLYKPKAMFPTQSVNAVENIWPRNRPTRAKGHNDVFLHEVMSLNQISPNCRSGKLAHLEIGDIIAVNIPAELILPSGPSVINCQVVDRIGDASGEHCWYQVTTPWGVLQDYYHSQQTEKICSRSFMEFPKQTGAEAQVITMEYAANRQSRIPVNPLQYCYCAGTCKNMRCRGCLAEGRTCTELCHGVGQTCSNMLNYGSSEGDRGMEAT